jgi:hypothetical protein
VASSQAATVRIDGAGTNQPSITSQLELMRPDPKRAAGMVVAGPDYKWFVGSPYYQTGTGLDFMIGYNTADQAERSGNYRLLIDTGGNYLFRGAAMSSSDARLKRNIEPIRGALETMTKLEGVSFEWIHPEEHGNQHGKRMGMIAQQVEEVLPSWVSTGTDGTKRIAYIGFEGLTVAAVHELKTAQERLTTENVRLAAENKSLAERLDRLERLVSVQSLALAKHKKK